MKAAIDIANNLWPESVVRCESASGALFLEIICNTFTTETQNDALNTFINEVKKYNSTVNNMDDLLIFHKIFLYEKQSDKFIVEGCLRTIMSNWGSMGEVTTLSSNDAFILISELDTEIHMHGKSRPVNFTFIVDESIKDFAFNENTKYLQLSFLGYNCRCDTISKLDFKGLKYYSINVYD